MEIQPFPVQRPFLVSYFRVGRLLYASLILFLLESYIYWLQLEKALHSKAGAPILFWMAFFLFSFLHIFLVLADGWSRFQDYKRAKDLFFAHGFNPRIARLYIRSKCQRMAAMVAAEELGIKRLLQDYYWEAGVKWYHFVPYFMLEDTLFIFKIHFWSRTFLEKNYKPKYKYGEQASFSLS